MKIYTKEYLMINMHYVKQECQAKAMVDGGQNF